MKTAAKVFAFLFCAAAAVVLSVAAAGAYKFNFTNDDIYVRGENGEILQYEEWRRRQ